MIFLDSDTLSYFLAEHPRIVRQLKRQLDAGETIAISTVAAYEILKGLNYRANLKKASRFNALLTHLALFPFAPESVPIAASIYADLRRSGITIGDADILIASTVIANNGVLVTNNQKHYQHIKALTLENWLDG